MIDDIRFELKGPDALRDRVAELRSRMGLDGGDFSAAMKEAAKPPMPMQGNIGSGDPDLKAFDPMLGPQSAVDPKIEVKMLIERVAHEQKIDSKLLRAVVEAESDYNPNDLSDKGAMGLMQLMPDTAKELGVKNAFDPYENLTGGAKYLKKLMAMFPDRTDLVLAAYNAGPGNVRKAGGIPDFAETKNYVRKIMAKLQ